MTKILIYDGELVAGEPALPLLCEIEGSVTPCGRKRYGFLEEAEKILEICGERYTVGRPTGDCMTVVVARQVGNDFIPAVRLDIHARNGAARASIQTYDFPRWDAEPVCYEPEDDAVEIVLKILAAL